MEVFAIFDELPEEIIQDSDSTKTLQDSCREEPGNFSSLKRVGRETKASCVVIESN